MINDAISSAYYSSIFTMVMIVFMNIFAWTVTIVEKIKLDYISLMMLCWVMYLSANIFYFSYQTYIEYKDIIKKRKKEFKSRFSGGS